MELRQLTEQAVQVQEAYRELNQKQGHQRWEAAEYMQGLVGDVGDLAKLVMAKNGFRHADDLDARIAHELADCLWAILVLANELNVDLEQAFTKTVQDLHRWIESQE